MASIPFRRSRGFSLIELLIALLFTSLLMAGMLRLYASTTVGFSAARESITAQRENRWAIGALEDDVAQAGMYFPFGHNTTSEFNNISVVGGNQNPLMVLPNNSVTFNASSPDGASVSETVKFDELQFLSDLPITVESETAAAALAGSNAVSLKVASGSLSHVKSGDLMFFLDPGGMEDLQLVGGVSGDSVTLTSKVGYGAGLEDPSAGGPSGTFTGALVKDHKAKTPALFVRLNMVVRYSIQPEALDPANPANRVPCLIREVAPYPVGGSLIDWNSISASPGYERERIMTHASGLRIDMSLNGGRTWTRAAASGTGTVGWGQMMTALNAQISGNPSPYNSINGSLKNWYKYVPVLFRLDLQTRSSNLRTENDPSGTSLKYKTRNQTIFVTPRNFSLESYR